MTVKINDDEIEGILGYLLAIPIVVVTFLWIALVFLLIVAVLLSPAIILILLIMRLL